MFSRKQMAATVAGFTGFGTAMAQTTPTGTDYSSAIEGLVTSQASYSTVMIGLAIAAVGIMIGVKWVKRAKGAA